MDKSKVELQCLLLLISTEYRLLLVIWPIRTVWTTGTSSRSPVVLNVWNQPAISFPALGWFNSKPSALPLWKPDDIGDLLIGSIKRIPSR